MKSTTPFESYELYRGQRMGKTPVGSLVAAAHQLVGTFKCIIRVTEGDPDDDPLFVDKNKFPQTYKVRLYVLDARNLTPLDIGFAGRPGKSDPYLLVNLGKEQFNDSSNYIEDVTDAAFFQRVELNCLLPGTGRLEVNVMDYDLLTSDQLIGRTIIDLEDRWFDQRWQV
ncbi:unnamed protein product, partial [Discosporangium mesarthrocarpum]